MSDELHFVEQWRRTLAAAGLGSFDEMMQSHQGTLVSHHTRGQTYRIELPRGQTVYLKRDAVTTLKDVLTDLSYLSRPQPPCIVELRALNHVAALGISAPQVLAWGQRRRASLPHQAVLVTRELAGTPLSELFKADAPADVRRDALCLAGALAAKLYRARLSWPDLAPKHFILDGDAVGILDLARMRRTVRPRWTYMPKQVRRFCLRLRARGGSEADRNAFLTSLLQG